MTNHLVVKLFVVGFALVFIIMVLGCDVHGACYYDAECPGCGGGFGTTIVRYCYNNQVEGACEDGCDFGSCQWNSVFVPNGCCEHSTILNPGDCTTE